MAQKALSLYEILELILIYTDRRTLLLSQRVCRKWNAHTNSSHNLQEALFFKPVRYELSYGSKKCVRNPSIDEHVWSWLVRKQIEAEAKKEEENHHNWYYYDSESELDTVSDPTSDPTSDSDNGDDDDPFARPEASWKRMRFQQPPTSHVGFIYYEFCWHEPSLYRRMRSLKPDYDPLRLKDIAPALEDGSMVADEGSCILRSKPHYSFDMIRNFTW